MMPTTTAILESLSTIANAWRWLAVLAHAALLLILIARRRWSERAVAYWLTLPLISVSLLAWWAGNPFNGLVFLLLVLSAARIATTMRTDQIRLERSRIDRTVGLGLIVFGWVYPHFLVAGTWASYLCASPLALIPCPTLAIVAGFSLLLSLDSRAWNLLIAAAGLVYGIVGVAALGVSVDGLLIAGSVALLAKVVRLRRQPRRVAA